MISSHPPTADDIERIKELFSKIIQSDLDLIKEVVYFNGWSDYEEGDGILIFKLIDDTYQMVAYGCSMLRLMSGYDTAVYGEEFEPEEISEWEAIEEINEMEKMINEGD